VLGLADPAPVPRLHQALRPAVPPPPPRPPLPRFRRAPGGGAAAGLGVVVVLAVLGADRPPRHQQPVGVWRGDRVGVDDAQVHPGHPAG
jgi:hypothetical protein